MKRTVESYYTSTESTLGYALLLGGRKHFGYYEKGMPCWQFARSMDLMESQLYRRLALDEGARVVDAGCGEGLVAINMATRFGLDIDGLELVERNADRAVKNVADRSLDSRIRIHHASYDKMPLPAGSFDGMYTMETLVHAPDYPAVLSECLRVLKPGGRLVCFEYTMPPPEDLTVAERSAFMQVIEGSSMTSMPQFHNGEFGALLEGAGFVDVAIEDLSNKIEPMLLAFAVLGYLPYKVARVLGQGHHFVNAMAGVEFYRHRDRWRYVVASAQKPLSQ